MKFILFSAYYSQLRLAVLLGLHKTCNPLDIRWRWGFWIRRYFRERPLRLY